MAGTEELEIPTNGFSNVFHLVITNPDGNALLIQHDGEKVRFPKIAPPKSNEGDDPWVNSWRSETNDLCTVIRKRFKLPVYVRRLLWSHPQPAGDEEVMVVVDFVGASQSFVSIATSEPQELDWITREDALTAEWIKPHLECNVVAILTEFFRESGDNGLEPLSRVPWRRHGWFLSTSEWVRETLSKHGIEPSEDVEQLRNSFQSTVMQCKVRPALSNPAADRVYVKQTISLIPESCMTNKIATVLPEFTPRVLTSTTTAFIQEAAPEDCCYAEPVYLMSTIAEMQLKSVDYVDELKEAGVPDRSLDWLASNVEAILEHDMVQLFEGNEQLRELLSRVDDIKKLCAVVVRCGIPCTLVHGDLDVSNIKYWAGPPSRVKFIDWANCCIAHPFYDYAYVTTVGWENVEDEDAKRCYLNKWTQFASYGQVEIAAKVIKPLMVCNGLFHFAELCASVEPVDRAELIKSMPEAFESILGGLNSAIVLLSSDSK